MKILIVIPAYNEEKIIAENIGRLADYCQKNLAADWQAVIADNRSSDRTAAISRQLAAAWPQVSYIFAAERGKGAAVLAGWNSFTADIYAFMDADLATDLSALPALINGILAGHDLVIGSRFHSQSKVQRTLSRRFFSNGYRLVARWLLRSKISDLPCGFKAISPKVKAEILPLIKDRQWFFDSELVLLAERAGLKIKEIPVIWRDPREGTDVSRVRAPAVAWAYIKRLLALRKRLK